MKTFHMLGSCRCCPFPDTCQSDADCGQYLFCDVTNNKCVSKVSY